MWMEDDVEVGEGEEEVDELRGKWVKRRKKEALRERESERERDIMIEKEIFIIRVIKNT